MSWALLALDVETWLADPTIRRSLWIGLVWALALGIIYLNSRFFDAVDERLTRFGIPQRRLAKLDVIADTFVVLLAGLATLSLFGVTEAVWGALAVTSVGGIVVGLAAQRAGENVLAGLVILFDRPFVVGDTIEIDDQRGQVERVSLHSTTMVTPDGLQLAIPNQRMLDGAIRNFSARPERRIRVGIDVDVPTERLDDARYAIREAVTSEKHLVEDRDVRVFADESLDEGVRFEARYWVDADYYSDHCRPSAMARVLEGLEAEGLDTARPAQTVHLEDGA